MKKEKKVKTGRPLANIDWKKVEDLLVTGCSGREVASYIGIDAQTIYERCVRDHGITFTQYSCQFYAKGDAILRATQFAKAIGKQTKGDNTLLIWLGKNRLKQVDTENNNKQTTYNIVVPHDLAIGTNISAEIVPEKSPEVPE